MKKLFTSLLGAALAACTTLGATAWGQCVVTSDNSGTLCYTLFAGQTINVGTVCVTVSGNNLEVKYSTTGGWELKEAHLWVGQSISSLPQTRTGNPIPGQFPFKSGDISGSTMFSFSIPLSNAAINFSCPSDNVCYYVAAHAALCLPNGDGGFQTETGWSDGSPITSRGNWATFSTFCLSCDCDDGRPEPVCDTVFAGAGSSSTCFLDDNFNRWGWTNGPLGPGEYAFNLWAGAGQCLTSNGYLAGIVTVSYNGSTATVTYTMAPGVTLNETHLYVGNTKYPKLKQGKTFVDTVAPGQYPYKHENLNGATSDTYTVNASGNIFVIAHGIACR